MSFLDKVKESFEKGVNTVSTKSKEMLDTSKLKRELDALQQQKNTALIELAETVHIGLQKGDFNADQAKEKSDAIVELETKINEKEDEIQQVKLKAQEELEKVNTDNNCECGTEIPPEAKFCPNCGKKID